MPMSNIEVLLYLIVSLHDNRLCDIFNFDETLQAAKELKTDIQQPIGDRIEIYAKGAVIKLKHNNLIEFVDANRVEFFLTETGKERIREIREECPLAAAYDADHDGDMGVRRSPRISRTTRRTFCKSPREVARKGRYYRRRLIATPNDLIEARDEENARLRRQLDHLIKAPQTSLKQEDGGEMDVDMDVYSDIGVAIPSLIVHPSGTTPSPTVYDPEDTMDVSYSGSDYLPSLCQANDSDSESDLDSDSDSAYGSPFSRTPSPMMLPTPDRLSSGENAFAVTGSSSAWHVGHLWGIPKNVSAPKFTSTPVHLRHGCDSNDATLVDPDTDMGDEALTGEEITKMHAGYVQRSTEIRNSKMCAKGLERVLEEKETELATVRDDMRYLREEISSSRQRWSVWNWLRFVRLHRMEKSNTQLSGTVENLEAEISKIRTERDRLNERLTQLVEENNQLKSDLEDRIQTITELQERMEADEIAHDTTRQQRDNAQGKLIRLFDEVRQTKECFVAAAQQSERMLTLF